MSRGLSADERRLWARVARTVKARRPAPPMPAQPATPAPSPRRPAGAPPAPSPPKGRQPPAAAIRPPPEPALLEPQRHRRLARERDPIEARLDLHGLGRFQAEDRLVAFLSDSHARGHRAVLVITGKGQGGAGIIRRSVAEWLASPRVRGLIAGFGPAHRRHGGEGALYIRLKRRPD